MSHDEVVSRRMTSLLLAGGDSRSPLDVVSWFGAMQAQDLASGQWSVGLRIPGATEGDVERAINAGEILRTWPMRGTIHLVPSRDAKWMVDLTADRVVRSAAGRWRQIGLTESAANRGAEILASALAGGRRLSRSQCVTVLTEEGSYTKEHIYQLLWYAAQTGVTCFGPLHGKEHTFVLLDEWVADPATPTREEALTILALRYFRSHGPTTVQDFAGWSGLLLDDARNGVEAAGDALATIDVEGSPHVLAAALLDERPQPDVAGEEVLVLPGFDEYLLGYKDRSLMVPAEHARQIVPGGNGIFMPTIVARGRVIGTWRRELKTKRVDIRPLPFVPLTRAQRSASHGPSRATRPTSAESCTNSPREGLRRADGHPPLTKFGIGWWRARQL